MDDQVIVSTMRIEDFPRAVPGSEVRQCYCCGGSVWLTPATKEALLKDGVKEFKVLCNRCRSPLSILLEETVVPPTPGQWAEVEKYIGEMESR